MIGHEYREFVGYVRDERVHQREKYRVIEILDQHTRERVVWFIDEMNPHNSSEKVRADWIHHGYCLEFFQTALHLQ